MLVARIVPFPHPALRYESRPVTQIDDALRHSVRAMFDLMYEAKGIGLAANQVALPFRFFILNITADPDQKDQDSLPPYDVLDDILSLYVEGNLPIREIIARGHDEELVRRITGLIDRNEYKREQAAPGLKVTGRAFGMGRRLPIAQRYTP